MTHRRFRLERDADVSGISGTGIVAEGVEFSDGAAVVHWLGQHPSTVTWGTIESVEAIHGHGGATRIVYLDQPGGALVSIPTLWPDRIRLSRKRGWRKPDNTVVVSRPSFWGNPFIVGTPGNGGNMTRADAVSNFKAALLDGRLQIKLADVRARLAGKNLACWCPLDEPCHADVLLDLANPGREA